MFKKVKELLENKIIDESVATALDSEIQSELSSLRDEAKQWREKFQDAEKTLTVSKEDYEKQLSDIDAKISKAREDGKAELVTVLEAERKEKNDIKNEFTRLEKEAVSLKIDNALNGALDGYSVIDKDLISLSLKQSVQVKDNVVSFADGKSLEDGVKAFFETKPHLLKPSGNGGSGKNDAGQEFDGYKEDSLTAQMLRKFK